MYKTIESGKGRINVFSDGGTTMQNPFTKGAWDGSNAGSTVAGLGSLMGYVTDNMANVKKQASVDTDRFNSFKSEADRIANTQFAAGDNDVVMNQASFLKDLDPLSKSDLRGNSIMKDLGTGWLQGAKGFLQGTSATGNPFIGGIMGALANASSDVGTVVGRIRAKRKAEESKTIAENARNAQYNNYNNAVLTTDRMNDFTALQSFKGAYGGYKEGQEYDLDESEVKRLLDSGYQIEYI